MSDVMNVSEQGGIPPHLHLVFRKWVSMLLDAVVRLGVPDLLADGQPRTADDLAANCGAHPDRLYRAMRALTNDGVFVEHEDRRFTLGEQGQFFRKDHPMSSAAMMMLCGGPTNTRILLNALEALRSGANGSEIAFGTDYFTHIATQPDLLSEFQSGMTELTKVDVPAIIDAYKSEWNKFEVICDVGGGHGQLLADVLKAAGGNARGILCDRPEVVAEAPKLLQTLGVDARVECREGDIFQAVPKGVDLYLIKHICVYHDDEQCIKLLKNCRENLRADGRVLILDLVVRGDKETPSNEASMAKYVDIPMLVGFTGRVRSEEQFARLCDAAGLTLKQHISLFPCDLIEAVPAEPIPVHSG